MQNNLEINIARDELASLVDARYKMREMTKRVDEASNRLAYLTATAMVVVDNGQDVRCLGVSPEAEAKLMRLRFNIISNDIISVTFYAGDEKVSFHLQPGGMMSFIITDMQNDTRIYKIWAFENEVDAGAWMSKRLADYSAR